MSNIYRHIANVPFNETRSVVEHYIFFDEESRIEWIRGHDPMVFDDREVPIEPVPDPGVQTDDEDSRYRDNSEDDE